MLYEIESIHVSIKHDGCWGRITDSSNVTIRTLVFKPFLEQSLMLGIISIKGDEPKDLSEFIEQFKRHKTIHKIISMKRAANVLNLAFFESSRYMTANIMSNYPLLWYSNEIIDGIEVWNIVLPRKVSSYLKQDLTDVAKILNWSSKYQGQDILSLYSQLTEVESFTLRKAEKLGYFESPRKIDLSELSSMIGVSKQAASVTLRRAVKKLAHNSMMD
ncbi:MAG: helix-turn-helix domain-containing protein [Thermoplasmatales archaeon]|nr:helix-turn-helix domain-containing protein [Thermoplasmatales archaeon]MCW6170354.1 helix-turn-helix domain-containing protein [Thermoplasmatales archaeon]